MKHQNKIVSIFLLITFALWNLSCASQTAQISDNTNSNTTVSTAAAGAQTPTEAYKMLFAACKAKDVEKIKQLMSKSSLGLAEFSGSQQKKSIDDVLKNGLLAPTLAPTLSEIRDERVKDNFGAVEVFNPETKQWEDLPFILEDGGWKVAVGDVFQDKYKSPGKGRAQIEREASNTAVPMMSNSMANMPEIPKGKNSMQVPPPAANESKSVEVPKENKPKK